MPGFTPAAKNLRLNLIHFEKLRPVLPAEKASQFLTKFFADVVFSASGAWARLPRQTDFTVRYGNLLLTFTSVGDTIPWEVVKDMGERLWQCARMGLADLFEAYFTDQTAQIGFKMTLCVIDQSLSSDSDEFYREGSVESVNGPEVLQQLGP